MAKPYRLNNELMIDTSSINFEPKTLIRGRLKRSKQKERQTTSSTRSRTCILQGTQFSHNFARGWLRLSPGGASVSGGIIPVQSYSSQIGTDFEQSMLGHVVVIWHPFRAHGI